jgi:Glycosyltransferase family 87
MLVHQGPLGRSQIRDTPRYEMYARAIAHRQVPYRDFSIEYPPGALLPIAAPLVASSSTHDSYRHWFEIWTALAGAAMAALTTRLVVSSSASARAAIGPALLVGLLPIELGTVVLTRFDLWPALAVVAAMFFLLKGRPGLSGIGLGIAVAMKIYAVALLPLVALYLLSRSGRGALWRFLVGAAGAVAAIVLPFAIVSPGGVWSTRGTYARGTLFFAMLTTQLWFPWRYWDLVLKFDAFSIWALLARNVLLIVLLGILLLPRVPALSGVARTREPRAA